MAQHIGNIGQLNLMNATEESIKGIEQIDNVGIIIFKKENAHLLQHLNIGNIGNTLEVPTGYKYHSGDLHLDVTFFESITDPIRLVVSGNVIFEKEIPVSSIKNGDLRLIVKGTVYSPPHLAGSLHSYLIEEANEITIYEGGAPRTEKGEIHLTNAFLKLFNEPQWLVVKGTLILAESLDMDMFKEKISQLEVKGTVMVHETQESHVLSKMKSLSKAYIEVIPDGYEVIDKAVTLNTRSIHRFKHKKLWMEEPLILGADISREALIESIDSVLSSSFIICPETLEDLIYERSGNLETEVLTYKNNFIFIEDEEEWSNDEFLAFDQPINLIVTGSLTLHEDVKEDILAEKVISVDLFGDVLVPNTKIKGKLRHLLRVNDGRLIEKSNKDKGTGYQNIGVLNL